MEETAMARESTPQYESIEPMTTGQFKALNSAVLNNLPARAPKGFAQYIVDTGKVGQSLGEIVAKEYRSWVSQHSHLRLDDPSTVSLPYSSRGTIAEWASSYNHKVYRHTAEKLLVTKELNSQWEYQEADALRAPCYRPSKPVSVDRIVACVGDNQCFRKLAINPVQVLRSIPQLPVPAYDQKPLNFFFRMVGDDTLVFLRLTCSARFESYCSQYSGTWAVEELIVQRDHVFRENERLLFREHIWDVCSI